jgi:3-oxoacyl-[acyl-carrier protein] reductase
MRNIVITGGATGIGLATATRFVAAGDRVVITGRREGILHGAATTLGAAATAMVLDATDPAAIGEALPALPDTVDVLVNNAGGNTDFLPAAGDGLAGLAQGWRANVEANLISALLMTEALSDRLTDDGHVITIGSIAAHNGAGSYGAAKAAVEAWNIGIAGELGTRGITANVVAPGLTLSTEFFRGRLTEARTKRLIDATLVKRAGTPDDVAATVFFLGSKDARHISGQVIHVDGGAYLGH